MTHAQISEAVLLAAAVLFAAALVASIFPTAAAWMTPGGVIASIVLAELALFIDRKR